MKTAIHAALLALTLAFGSAHAADAKPATAGAPGMIAGDVVKAEAEVVGIDKKTRTLTLAGPSTASRIFMRVLLWGLVEPV